LARSFWAAQVISWEALLTRTIRAKGQEGIGRSLYCMMKGQEIVILHSFIKKTQKTPKKELDLAKKRMKEVNK